MLLNITMRIRCRTRFDCTRTGITGRFRVVDLPFQDESGAEINDQATWTRGRNQQRNWETLLQILGLRTQPMEIQTPQRQGSEWVFEFSVESEGVYGQGSSIDPFAGLKNDAQDIPMLTGLTEIGEMQPRIETSGDNQNIWFETLNTALE